MSLGLNDNPSGTPYAGSPYLEPPSHKSAGLAFLLSLVIPGAGQYYCGENLRGGVTLGFWGLGLVLCFKSISPAITGQALIVMMVLWIFSFLDAYFTAIEINEGKADLLEGLNPRVGVTLNLLTAGFGYFYLGDRAKGIALFVLMQVGRLMLPSKGAAGVAINIVLFLVQILAAVDAYRIARGKVKEALGPQAAQPVGTSASRLPVFVPVAVACVLVFGFIVLALVGLAVRSRQAVNRTGTRAKDRGVHAVPPSGRAGSANRAPVVATDLASTVQDVQRVERETVRKPEEISYLSQDVKVLASVLRARKVAAADAVVAHYYRALALTLINIVHRRQGGPIDAAGARQALNDFDAVIGSGLKNGSYVAGVTPANAEYWAGVVARNQLKDENRAYGYWEKCADAGHAGCVNTVATAHVTGAGGEMVDIRQALDLHTSVFQSGTKYRCAGAFSAMSIAYINYFTGVKRPGDDELEWAQKSIGLLEQLGAAERDPDACHRGEHKIDEFLFRMSRGDRDNQILQEAVGNLDDDSKTTRAVIQFIFGAIDQAGFETAVENDKLESARCAAYFDAMWYAELMKQDQMARRYHQRMVDLGKFHCGSALVYANKFKL